MAKKYYETKSTRALNRLWREALTEGECPFQGCDLKQKSCPHLDNFLEYSSTTHTSKKTGKVERSDVLAMSTEDIEEFGYTPSADGTGAWRLFKLLRGYALNRDQIGILIRVFVYNMSQRQVMQDMHYTSWDVFHRRYVKALALLKRKGFRGGDSVNE